MQSKPIVLWDVEVRETVHKVIDALELEGKHEIIIRKHSGGVNARQRGYYWGVMLPAFVRHLEEQYSVDEIHQFLKAKFGITTIVEIHGEALSVVDFTTSNMGRIDEMSGYIETILNYAAGNLGLYIEPAERGRK